MSSTSKAS